ncbi:MAG TPA: thioredoxin domain-containing protein [Microbacteriaceae bacterium]|nr:thioredoxin domain-containing protein [Microbacteriaceae bacterium]
MSNASLQPRATKNQKREEAREKARQMREEQAKRSKRNRILVQVGAIVGVIAVAAAVFLGYQSWQAGQISSSAGPANMLSDGLVLNAQGPVQTDAIPAGGEPVATVPDPSGSSVSIVTYFDYLCPYCGQFENTNGAYIDQLVQKGATLELHPIAILTSNSAGTRYSERAANAFACVANTEPQVASAFNAILFANQPAEGTGGHDNAKLKEFVAQAGATKTEQINSCIDDKTFKNWVQAATERALKGPIPNSSLPRVTGTPTVLVNGKQYSGSLTDPNEFKAFVVQALSESAATATPTPAP